VERNNNIKYSFYPNNDTARVEERHFSAWLDVGIILKSRFFSMREVPKQPLTGIRLWAHICAHLYFELRDCFITFPIFVSSQRLIARNVRELFSFNHGISHLNEARASMT
jgi:hypothetical protein